MKLSHQFFLHCEVLKKLSLLSAKLHIQKRIKKIGSFLLEIDTTSSSSDMESFWEDSTFVCGEEGGTR